MSLARWITSVSVPISDRGGKKERNDDGSGVERRGSNPNGMSGLANDGRDIEGTEEGRRSRNLSFSGVDKRKDPSTSLEIKRR